MDERIERWAISILDVDSLKSIRGTDRLLCSTFEFDENDRPTGRIVNVTVLRNGFVPGTYWESSEQITNEERVTAELENTLFHPIGEGAGYETTLRWVDVVVGINDEFLRVASANPEVPHKNSALR